MRILITVATVVAAFVIIVITAAFVITAVLDRGPWPFAAGTGCDCRRRLCQLDCRGILARHLAWVVRRILQVPTAESLSRVNLVFEGSVSSAADPWQVRQTDGDVRVGLRGRRQVACLARDKGLDRIRLNEAVIAGLEPVQQQHPASLVCRLLQLPLQTFPELLPRLLVTNCLDRADGSWPVRAVRNLRPAMRMKAQLSQPHICAKMTSFFTFRKGLSPDNLADRKFWIARFGSRRGLRCSR